MRHGWTVDTAMTSSPNASSHLTSSGGYIDISNEDSSEVQPLSRKRSGLDVVADSQVPHLQAASPCHNCCSSAGTLALVVLAFAVGACATMAVMARPEATMAFRKMVAGGSATTRLTQDVDLAPISREVLQVDRLYCRSLLATLPSEPEDAGGASGSQTARQQLLLAQLKHGVVEAGQLEVEMQVTKKRLQEEAAGLKRREQQVHKHGQQHSELTKKLQYGTQERIRLESKLQSAMTDLNSTLLKDQDLRQRIEEQDQRIAALLRGQGSSADGSANASSSNLRATQIEEALSKTSQVTSATLHEVFALRQSLDKEMAHGSELRQLQKDLSMQQRQLLLNLQETTAAKSQLDARLKAAKPQLQAQLEDEHHILSLVKANQEEKEQLLQKLEKQMEAKKDLSEHVDLLKDQLAKEVKREKKVEEDEASANVSLTTQLKHNVELKHTVDLLQNRLDQTWIGHVGPSRKLTRNRRAFVMLSYDPPGQPANQMWGVLAMARAVQRLSDYPLVLLTNSTHFADGTPVKKAMEALNVQIMPVKTVPPPRGKHFAFEAWNIAWWKIQIWTLTQFDQLIWLDSDSILTRSIDWLFERQGMWAQRDDWFCQMNQEKVCSGIMLLQPTVSDFDGILKFGETADLSHGDQQVIAAYFQAVNRPIQLLSDLEASFGQCIGTARTPYLNKDKSVVRGSWSTPTFVHKSGGWGNTNNNEYSNVCFSHELQRQLYKKGKVTVNMCQYHPLGAYWRTLFCEAVAMSSIYMAEVQAYCSDRCWYLGDNGDQGAWAQLCAPSGHFNTTVDEADYVAKLIGTPVEEMTLHPTRSQGVLAKVQAA